MPQLRNRAGMSTTTAGQGTITLASALGAVAINVAGMQSFSAAGVLDGEIVEYLILDANGNWEVGTGTYTASGTTLSRTIKYSSNSNTAIALSGSAQVFINALAADGGDVLGGTTNPMRGFDSAVNLQINATQNGALLTIAIKGNNGNDPSPTNPVMIAFRDSTAANGDPIWRAVTAALSINTNATGATLGSVNNTAFRFWVCAFDNAGTVVLALVNCSTATQIFPLYEGLVVSTTGISASATAAGTFYTPNGTSLTNKSFRILGYVEYNSTGLATAGTYATSPNFIQVFGPGIKKPGDVVREQYMITTTQTSTSATAAPGTATAATISYTPTSAANPLRVMSTGTLYSNTSGNAGIAQIWKNSGATAVGSVAEALASGAVGALSSVCMRAWDIPNTIGSVDYTVYIYEGAAGGNLTYYPFSGNGRNVDMSVQEIMG
jgi:hypothetical protein